MYIYLYIFNSYSLCMIEKTKITAGQTTSADDAEDDR